MEFATPRDPLVLWIARRAVNIEGETQPKRAPHLTLTTSLNLPDFQLTRFLFQRALALIYLIGFLIVVNQYVPLLGSQGLLPIPLFLRRASFLDAPSVFFAHYSDGFALALGWLGVALSLFALSGLSDSLGMAVSVATWLLLWALYLSFVNVGQTFYGFGWETLLLEMGFLAVFLGPRGSAAPAIVVWMYRWVLFRLMFGAGMIKMRGDPCWRDLTCLMYHYETQPIPNALSWYFHHAPRWLLRFEVLFNHFIELVVPWFFFVPGVIGAIAGGLTIIFQCTLILSGNLSWLNYVTLVCCIPCFDDRVLLRMLPFLSIAIPKALRSGGPAMSVARKAAIGVLTFVVGILSIRPARNLISDSQMMNASFEPLHLVNTYGAFGSITRQRYEIEIEGTSDAVITPRTKWLPYEFKGKPGEVDRRPPLISPYHLRLDWQMWFAAMGPYYQQPWILNFVAKLLEGDAPVLSLLRTNPFPGQPPKYVRAELYLYHFTDPGDASGAWWKRERVESYLPPLSLDDPRFHEILVQQGWI